MAKKKPAAKKKLEPQKKPESQRKPEPLPKLDLAYCETWYEDGEVLMRVQKDGKMYETVFVPRDVSKDEAGAFLDEIHGAIETWMENCPDDEE